MVLKSDGSDDSNHKVDKLQQQISTKQKKIKQLTAKSDSLLYVVKGLEVKYESLQNSKNEVKTKYRKVYVYIDHATNLQLDSLIRSNW